MKTLFAWKIHYNINTEATQPNLSLKKDTKRIHFVKLHLIDSSLGSATKHPRTLEQDKER